MRLLRRLEENLFNIYVYSADKIEAKEGVLIVGEVIIIFEDQNQPSLYEVPISQLISSHEAHTATNERERLRKQLGHVSHLHQIVLDIGKEAVLRILSSDRDAIRRRLEGVIESVNKAKQEKDAEELEKQRLQQQQQQQQQEKQSPAVQQPKVEKYTLLPSSFQIACWLFNETDSDISDIVVTVEDSRILVLDAQSHEILKNISVDTIKSWRQERTSYDNRTKFVAKLKAQAYEVHQLFIEVDNSNDPVRILSLERWKLRNIIKLISDEFTTISKEEFWCQLLQDADLRNVILKFVPNQVEFRDPITHDSVLEVPVKNIVGWEVKPINDGLKNKFEQGIEESIILNIGSASSSLLIGTDEVSHIVNELKKYSIIQKSMRKPYPNVAKMKSQ
jgi:hypothetical protein